MLLNPLRHAHRETFVFDLCELMGSLLCSETCVPTPGSYYCNCSTGSSLQADGRTCLPDVTSTVTPRSTVSASTTTRATIATTKVTSSSSSSSTTPAKKSPPTAKAKTSKPTKATARSTLKVSSSVTRPRTTRSLSTEPNEHNSLCPSGYRFTSSEICDDIDECSEGPTNPCPPSSMCFNTKGSFRCFSISLGNNSADRCELGYRWDDALEQCLDIDECAENIHKCLIDGEICKNLDGSYECEIVCEKGYAFDSTYGACLDIDECVELINVCLRPDTVCVNTLGGYECVKVRDYNQLNEPNLFASNGTDYGRSGFDYEDLLEEEDIDECQIHEQPCAPEEVCRNTVAGYDCIPIGCPKGFAMAEDQSCRDVDECRENSHSCAENERCQNTNGSFTCEQPRSTPAPTTAEPPKIYCRKGFKANPARQRNHGEAASSSELCVDVDECLEGPGCREHEKCSNLLGSYECSPLCGPGWFFQPQSKSCQDVDECLLGHHNCRRSQYCVNRPGGFGCEPLGSCAAGYRRLQNGSCVDVDECLEGLHTCSRDSHRYCVNRDGGYECITRLPSCPRGYEYSLLSRQCQDVDECRQARASCDPRAERCLNLPGGYRCERLPNDPNRPGHRKRPACPNGLVYEPELRKCAERPAAAATAPPNIDECAEGTHNCGKERCYNLPGSFQCAKAVVRPVRKRITPTTRMSELTTDSQIQSTTESHYCDYGYKYNATIGSCVDVDECVERKEVCSPTTEECENSQGGYSCRCRTGFRRDNETKACLDINECLLQNACNTSQRCDNTIGSYTCIRFLPCGTGYTLNAATELCEDDDECVMGTHDCSPGYRCRNTLGSFRCDKDRSVKPTGRRPVVVRPPPFLTTPRPTMTPRITTKAVTTSTTSSPMRTSTKASVTPKINSNSTLAPKMETTTPRPKEVPDKKATKPVSKTKPSSAPFTPFSSNTSTPRPRPKCPPGFETGPIGQCMDVDECQQNPRVCGSRKCINTIGSFNCDGPVIICPPGYAPDFLSGRCKDVDECLQGTHKCGEQQTCENRPGGYVCYCPRGYEVRNRDCVDVNECERGRPCGSSKCLNAPGSYRCLCEAGFENDATGACQDIDECSRDPASCQHECYNTWGGYRCGCKYGYRLKPDNRTCVDVDECAENKGLCHGICDNTPGSYRCTCPKGYLLEADGHTCTDIDECKQENVCKNPGELCQNLRGGHRCNKIDCPAGYIIDKNRKNRCIRETPYCSVHDKACFQRPAHYTYNYIAIVSMFPIPVSTNQVELFTMRGAYNLPGATMQFSIAFIQARAPPHVQPATESYFALRRPFPTQAVLVMTKSLQGPQDIELEFAMEIYAPNGSFAGSAIARIFIVVSQYEF
ncbi:hypothetical protein TKK_0008977 [Trichogramma kaykai]